MIELQQLFYQKHIYPLDLALVIQKLLDAVEELQDKVETLEKVAR